MGGCPVGRNGCPPPPKKSIRPSLSGIKMSAAEEEEGQDYDDILGFPGDGFKDNDDVDT